MSVRRLPATAVVAGGIAAYVAIVRSRLLRFGATDAEVEHSLPGDESIEEPDLVATRAITIAAPADQIWPWMVGRW